MTDRSLDKKCILLNFWSSFQKIHRNAPHSDLYQNCLNVVATPNKLTARAVDKKYLQAASSLNHWYIFKNDFTHMFIIRPSGKICTIGSALLNKMATRTKKNLFTQHQIPIHWSRIKQNNSIIVSSMYNHA